MTTSVAKQVFKTWKTLTIGTTEVDLVRVSVADLGFRDNSTRGRVFKRAQELGVSLCSDETAQQLRELYTEMPDNEFLIVANKFTPVTIACLDKARYLFPHDYGNNNEDYHPEMHLVFLQGK